MVTVVVVLLVCLLLAVAAAIYRHRGRRIAGTALVPQPRGADWRPVAANDQDGVAAVELWWELSPVVSIERLGDRNLPASVPVRGALGELVARLLDDETVRQVLAGERFALVRLPAGSRARDFVRTVDGRTVPIVRDASGRFGKLGTVVGGTGAGAGFGTVVATAPAVAGAVAAAWAHQQLTSTMTAMREGLERIAIRLDDSDHGVLAAAQAHLASLSGSPSTWSEFDRDALAHHRVALDAVYHTAKRRADRRFRQLENGVEIPRFDPAEVAEIQRDFVLRVDAELVTGQMDLVRAVAMIESDPDAALVGLADVELRMASSLDALAARMGAALDLGLPGRHRVGARKSARQLQAEVASTLEGLRELLEDLTGDNPVELLVGVRDGELELRSFEPLAIATGESTTTAASESERSDDVGGVPGSVLGDRP